MGRLSSVILAAGIGLAAVSMTRAQTNPFEELTRVSFTGRFTNANVTLRLKAAGDAYTGQLLFQGQEYALKAQAKAGSLQGSFGDGAVTWPFTAKADGDVLHFTTDNVNEDLQRSALPSLEGCYSSKQGVKLQLKLEQDRYTGTVSLRDEQFPLEAKPADGLVEGTFKKGTNSIAFSVEPGSDRAVIFKTGSFAGELEHDDCPARAEQARVAQEREAEEERRQKEERADEQKRQEEQRQAKSKNSRSWNNVSRKHVPPLGLPR